MVAARLLSLILIIHQAIANGDSGTYLKYGAGINGDAPRLSIFTGYQGYLTNIVEYQLEAGIPRPGIFGVSPSIGVSTMSRSGMFLKVFFGPLLLTNWDDRLGGLFQFNNDLELGLKGQNGFAIGVNYKHISNAGITQPNLGRDFILLKLQLEY